MVLKVYKTLGTGTTGKETVMHVLNFLQTPPVKVK
jgi:hypothetical protein